MFPQPAGPALARLAYQKIYGSDVREGVADDMVVRDEYLGWIMTPVPSRQVIFCTFQGGMHGYISSASKLTLPTPSQTY